jgi:hypothetical protein
MRQIATCEKDYRFPLHLTFSLRKKLAETGGKALKDSDKVIPVLTEDPETVVVQFCASSDVGNSSLFL